MTKIQILNTTLFIIVLIFCAVLSQLYKQQIINQLNAWKLLPEPETFTELYFNNNLNLPSTVKQNQQIKFAFTVHNLEYKTYNYPYKIYLEQKNKKTEINEGKFSLNQDQYKTISDSYTLSQPITRAQIVVNLTQMNQDIFFWINGTPTKPTPTPKITKTYATKIQPVKKKYGAWYWQPLLKEAFVWLGLDKVGNDIWGTSFPIKTKPKTNTSSSSNSAPTTTPTPKPGVTITATIAPTQTVVPTVILTPTPTVVQINR